MHLGRFHTTIYDLTNHFKTAELPVKLEQCAASLDQYAQTKAVAQLEAFRTSFDTLLKASEVQDPDLKQPFALQVIADLSVADALDPGLSEALHRIVQERAFDHVAIAKDFRDLATHITKKTALVSSIDKAFSDLGVEFERVQDTEAEVGILLPREIVGETLSALTSEFNKLEKLFRAINELTGAQNYDPTVRTISSSWWQLFLELEPTQIMIWIIAIERIVALFKSNLEIKNLQQQLLSKEMPEKITDLIEEEINKRVSSSLQALAAEICKDYAKNVEKGRLNEIEIQLQKGLCHLAMRINQGAQVEINVAVPDEPKEPPAPIDGEEPNQELQAQIASQRAKIAELSELRTRSRTASTETLRIDGASQVLLKYFEAGKSQNDEPHNGT